MNSAVFDLTTCNELPAFAEEFFRRRLIDRALENVRANKEFFKSVYSSALFTDDNGFEMETFKADTSGGSINVTCLPTGRVEFQIHVPR